MTIELGYWLVPLVITILSFIPLWWSGPARGDDGFFGFSFETVFFCGFGLYVSLVAWCVYLGLMLVFS